MAVTIPAASRQAATDAIVDLVDGGAGAGTIQLRTGSAPDPDVAATGTLLATLTYSDPSFGAADTDGIATANSIADDTSADANGDAGYFRIEDSDSNCVWQGTVTATGGGGDLELNTVTIVALGTVSITAQTLQTPQAQS